MPTALLDWRRRHDAAPAAHAARPIAAVLALLLAVAAESAAATASVQPERRPIVAVEAPVQPARRPGAAPVAQATVSPESSIAAAGPPPPDAPTERDAEPAADAPPTRPPQRAVDAPAAPSRRPAALAALAAEASVLAPRRGPRPVIRPVTRTRAARRAEPRGGGTAARLATLRDGLRGADRPQLLGVVRREDGRYAFLRARDGAVRRLRRGDRIDGWTVTAISTDSVDLRSGSGRATLAAPRR